MSTAGTTENTKENSKLKNLCGPTDPKLDSLVREKLITARVGLLLRASFFGNLATRLKLVNADEWCSTAATDGRNFYYNSRFIDQLKPKEVEFLFGHEVLHCVYDHMNRRGDRDPQLWNIADDYCVNSDLIKHRVGEKITTVPCLYDPKYDGMSSEEVYDILYENAEKINISDLLDKLLDDHMDGDDQDGQSNGDENQNKCNRPTLTKAERDQIRDEIKEALLSAAAASDGAGNLPAGVKRIISDLTAPKINWRELLRMQLESMIKSDYTWMRSSRKGWHLDSILPGRKPDEMIDVAIMLDASGSMDNQMLRDFLSEIAGIADAFPCYRIHLATFDTEVYNAEQFDSENFGDMEKYEVAGGGGTDFNCMFSYLKENEIEPKRLIVLTDGYPCGSWGDSQYCHTVWIIHGNTTIEAPFGLTTYYSKETT